MVLTCCVVGCKNRGGRDKGVSFYHIPAVLSHQGEQTLELSSKRRQEWIARIKRKEWVPSKFARVCSDHFVSGMSSSPPGLSVCYPDFVYNLGKPATLQDSTNPDWVPSLKMGYDTAISKDTFERYSRQQTRKRKQIDIDTAESLLLLAECEAGTLCQMCDCRNKPPSNACLNKCLFRC